MTVSSSWVGLHNANLAMRSLSPSAQDLQANFTVYL